MQAHTTALVLCIGLFLGLLGPDAAAAKPPALTGAVEVLCATDSSDVFVFIPGRPFILLTGPDGSFELTAVPEGTYTVRAETRNATAAAQQSNVVVGKKETTPVSLELLGTCPTGIANGLPCTSNSQCASRSCDGGGSNNCAACTVGADCALGSYCNTAVTGGTCLPLRTTGAACSADAAGGPADSCASGFCTNGRCD